MWERLVASVKRCAKKVIGLQRLSFIELQTLMFEIELILKIDLCMKFMTIM